MRNIVLVGMPASGKSTIGVLLAKALGMGFIDTDLLIQEKEGALLQDILNDRGFDKFLETEESIITGLNILNSVIATGGSVIYSDKAMSHLKQSGKVVFIMVGLDELMKRLTNISTRGIVFGKCKNLEDLYNERMPLYVKHADIIIETGNADIEGTVKIILDKLRRM